MLVLSIATNNYADAFQQIKAAYIKQVEAIELRLDYFLEINMMKIQKLREACKIPVIFTLRKKDQGGHYQMTENQRLMTISNLLKLEPDYFDIEYNISSEFLVQLSKNLFKTELPYTKLICTFHDFEKTPADLLQILQSMINPVFSIYKIATFARSTLDSLRMLIFVKENSGNLSLAGMCMGEYGDATRILAPTVNSAFTYTFLPGKSSSALGQIDVDELTRIYRYQKLSPETKIYSLIGDPIEQSMGHVFHNNLFEQYNQNAVYIKMRLKSEELKVFFNQIKKLSFSGFSVTMPLKETVMPHIDIVSEEVKKIKAVNTIKLKNNVIWGYNTDSIGALNALEEVCLVKNKHLVILGAGGTARAIIFEAKKRGAIVIVINRDIKKGENLAKEFGCQFISTKDIDIYPTRHYDIFVNATSLGMKKDFKCLPFPENSIFVNSITSISPRLAAGFLEGKV